ncbi:hypothetical protein BDV95DRAFT_484770 [Massariosphaeria phaeospora]|uniref:DUF3253 domain-containing protein n=1 Tax=Massariosphaeria phaeospora TaxID=100035 RepID=A0A7C8MHN0_9PLEO|nr:hypothetical protein BDV95DRAFT_484770 [Massariosphaeria phaeospora]
MPLDDSKTNIISGHAQRLLGSRDWPKTICPSEIARALSKEELDLLNASEWRETMDDIREWVWQRRELGEVEVLQKGQVAAVARLEDIRGPIRVRATRV